MSLICFFIMFIRLSLGSVELDELADSPFLELAVGQEASDEEGDGFLFELELSDVEGVEGSESFWVDAGIDW